MTSLGSVPTPVPELHIRGNIELPPFNRDLMANDFSPASRERIGSPFSNLLATVALGVLDDAKGEHEEVIIHDRGKAMQGTQHVSGDTELTSNSDMMHGQTSGAEDLLQERRIKKPLSSSVSVKVSGTGAVDVVNMVQEVTASPRKRFSHERPMEVAETLTLARLGEDVHIHKLTEDISPTTKTKPRVSSTHMDRRTGESSTRERIATKYTGRAMARLARMALQPNSTVINKNTYRK